MTRALPAPILGAVVIATALMNVAPASLHGYTLLGARWPSAQVPYYVNPRNVHMSETLAISAIQAAADVWRSQSGANIELAYAGQTNGSSAVMNRKNEVFFRESNGSYSGQAYYWWDSAGRLVDADVIFYEGAYSFHVGGGCRGAGVYLENVAVHEFGHALGLRHSDAQGATMYASTPFCDREQFTLDGDDIAAVRALYPPSAEASGLMLPQAPAAPGSLAVYRDGANPGSALVLTWQDNSPDEQGFRIERSHDLRTITEVAYLGPNTTSFVDSGLMPGVTYYYRLHAFNAQGWSPYSNIAFAATGY